MWFGLVIGKVIRAYGGFCIFHKDAFEQNIFSVKAVAYIIDFSVVALFIFKFDGKNRTDVVVVVA